MIFGASIIFRYNCWSMDNKQSHKGYEVLLYYKFTPVDNPAFEAMQHKLVCAGLGLHGRILIAAEGINGTVAGTRSQIRRYIEYMNKHPDFADIDFKRSHAEKMPFGKLIVKARVEMVTLGCAVDLGKKGRYIAPEQLHQLYEEDEDFVIVDMRNNYEFAVGRFAGAIQPDTRVFADLPDKIKSLELYKNKKVITYCTGGIRCEKASALLVMADFANVYQLEGGIVRYLEKYPDGYFEGKNFVFDGRMVTNSETPSGAKVLAHCEHCGDSCDRYIDCAKSDCRQLFICCEQCEKDHGGLCPVATGDKKELETAR